MSVVIVAVNIGVMPVLSFKVEFWCRISYIHNHAPLTKNFEFGRSNWIRTNVSRLSIVTRYKLAALPLSYGTYLVRLTGLEPVTVA